MDHVVVTAWQIVNGSRRVLSFRGWPFSRELPRLWCRLTAGEITSNAPATESCQPVFSLRKTSFPMRARGPSAFFRKFHKIQADCNNASRQHASYFRLFLVSSSGTTPRKCCTFAATTNCFPARSIVSLRSCPGVPPSIAQTCPMVDPLTGISLTATR